MEQKTKGMGMSRVFFSAATAVFVLTALWRVGSGEWRIPLSQTVRLLSPFLSEAESVSPEALIVRSVRLPRFLAASGAGGLLALSGLLLQGVLANPLAEPYTLGVASGAALGGALGFFLGSAAVAPLAFAGALGALALVLLLSQKSGRPGAMVLAGIISNSILSAGVTLLKALADDRLGTVVLWLMGSFSGADGASAVSLWIASALMLAAVWYLGPRLDALSLGEGQGERLGISERALRLQMLCLASLGTALTVSRFGIIGFVGLVVPHGVRKIFGPVHRPLSLICFLSGALLLSLADGAAQHLGELPVGVLTALLGGPFFCHILLSGRRS